MVTNGGVAGRGRYVGLVHRAALGLGSAVAFLVICEVVLRLVWANPYRLEPMPEPYIRLHRPEMRASVSARYLYPDGGRVEFCTGPDRAVVSGKENRGTFAVALGGSTTESALVPEGSRWPDLVAGSPRNYGVSGNTSVDSYWNLRFLTALPEGPIETVYLTHAVNDLRAYLSEGAKAFDVETWRQPPVDLLGIDQPGQQVAPGVAIRDSWLLSFLRFTEREVRGRSIFDAYLANRNSQAHLPTLDEASFRGFRHGLRTRLLPARARVFGRIADVAGSVGARVVICSQPHAYRSDYRPFHDDLRLFPVVKGKRLSTSQAAEVMGILNRQNMAVAEQHGWRAVDAAAVFAVEDPSPLFYDSVHFTPSGSRLFAEVVTRSR